jgi:hypothetical protein
MNALSDTPAKVLHAQATLLRQAGPTRRAALGLAMTTQALALSRRAIQQRNPDLSEQDVLLLWAEIHYGKALADRVRVHLMRQHLARQRLATP